MHKGIPLMFSLSALRPVSIAGMSGIPKACQNTVEARLGYVNKKNDVAIKVDLRLAHVNFVISNWRLSYLL